MAGNTERRRLLHGMVLGAAALLAMPARRSFAAPPGEKAFAVEAARQRDLAIAAGDQPYGAVVVFEGRIAGYGPSRVVVDRNPDAHAERVALADATRQLTPDQLARAVIYATSRPCPTCQAALARARIARMYVGPEAVDAGPPVGG
jgi:tRNA(Arg) A34 adenosine deaminase TadA